MALANMGFKDQTLVSCLEEENRMGEENGRRGRRRGRRRDQGQKGMETTLIMDFVWITWNFKALYGKYLVSKSKVLIELNPNLRFLEIKVGKNSKSTRKVRNPPFEVGFMVK